MLHKRLKIGCWLTNAAVIVPSLTLAQLALRQFQLVKQSDTHHHGVCFLDSRLLAIVFTLLRRLWIWTFQNHSQYSIGSSCFQRHQNSSYFNLMAWKTESCWCQSSTMEIDFRFKLTWVSANTKKWTFTLLLEELIIKLKQSERDIYWLFRRKVILPKLFKFQFTYLLTNFCSVLRKKLHSEIPDIHRFLTRFPLSEFSVVRRNK